MPAYLLRLPTLMAEHDYYDLTKEQLIELLLERDRKEFGQAANKMQNLLEEANRKSALRDPINRMKDDILDRLGITHPDLIPWNEGDIPRVEALKKGRNPKPDKDIYDTTTEELDSVCHPSKTDTPMQSVGKSITRAFEKYRALAKDEKQRDALYDLTDTFYEVTEDMTPEEAAAYMDRAFDEYAESVLKAEAKDMRVVDTVKSGESRQNISSSGNFIAQLETKSGILDFAELDDTVPGWVDRREEIRNTMEKKDVGAGQG